MHGQRPALRSHPSPRLYMYTRTLSPPKRPPSHPVYRKSETWYFGGQTAKPDAATVICFKPIYTNSLQQLSTPDHSRENWEGILSFQQTRKCGPNSKPHGAVEKKTSFVCHLQGCDSLHNLKIIHPDEMQP